MAQKVKFHIYSTLAKYNEAKASLVGTVVFVKENHTLYVDQEQYCVIDGKAIQDAINSTQELKTVWDQITTNKNDIVAIKQKNTTQDSEIEAIKEKNTAQDEEINNLKKIDLSLYKVVTELPSSDINPDKVYLLKATPDEDGNVYDEYIYVDSKWEKLGTFRSKVDLTEYAKTAEVAATYATKEELNTEKDRITKEISDRASEITRVENQIASSIAAAELVWGGDVY